MQEPQYLIDFVNVYGGITSLIVGFISIFLSVFFFVAAKKHETESAILLTKIDERVETLRTINNNLLGTAIQHLATSNEKIIDNFFSVRPLESKSSISSDEPNDDIALYIMIYFYSGRANVFAKLCQSNIPLNDENKNIHQTAENAIEESTRDFKVVSDWLKNKEDKDIKNHRLYGYYANTKEYWEPYVFDNQQT
ncbi:MAG: hypothetical protein GQ547_03795 [Methylophaga sp.]|nr:hypothetical protein [Methylophaga sp.]